MVKPLAEIREGWKSDSKTARMHAYVSVILTTTICSSDGQKIIILVNQWVRLLSNIRITTKNVKSLWETASAAGEPLRGNVAL
jgi:hypothetical protein